MKAKILVHDYSGHPFQVQLSRWLSGNGYQVLHVYSHSFQTPKGALVKQETDPPTLDIRGISLSAEFQKYSFVKRRSQEIEYGNLLSRTLSEFSPELVISSNTPLDTQAILWENCRKLNIPHVFWLQDVYSAAISKILSNKIPLFGALIGKYYTSLEKNLLRQSDEVVVITEDFIPLMEQWEIVPEKVHVVPNWAPLEEVPICAKSNSWSQKHELEKDFVFLYSGTLGMKHNPEVLIRLAQHFDPKGNVKVVVISEGLGADWLKQQKKELNLGNLILLNFQPFEIMPEVLGSADVLVALLEPSAGVYSVPSKVLTYLCAGKALLLAVPLENLASRIVSSHNLGEVVLPGDIEAFLEGAMCLQDNSERRIQLGQNARNYAERTFDIQKIGFRFENIIKPYTRRGKI
jgi:glycosyltransferase involved in cell wall biosynthesis